MNYSSEMYGTLLVYRNDGQKGPIYDLSKGTTKIGASINADIRLKLQDNRLEEVHCVVQVEENGTAFLISKSSEAPVIVNGDALSQKKYRILKHEDHFVVLGKKFQYLNEHIVEQDHQKTVSANRKSVAPISQTISTEIPVQQRTVNQKTENRGRLKNYLSPNKHISSRTYTWGSKTTSKLVVSKSFSKLPTPRRRLSLNIVPQVLGAAKRTSIPKKACDCCVDLNVSNSPKKSILRKSTPSKSKKSLLLDESTKSNSSVEGKDRSLPIEEADKMQDSSVSSSVDESRDEEDLKLLLSEEEFSSQRCSRTSESQSTPPSEEGTPERISRSSRSSVRGRTSSVILDNETDLEAKALEVSKILSRRMNISNSSRSPSLRRRTSLVNDKMIYVEGDTPNRTSARKRTSSLADIRSSTKIGSVVTDHLNDNKNEKTSQMSKMISRGVFRSSSSRKMSSVDDSCDEEDLKLLLSEEEFPSQICSRILESKSTSSPEEETTGKMSRSSRSSARGRTSSVILDNETDLEANALEVTKRLSRRMYRSSISSVGDTVDCGNLAENIPNSTRLPSVKKTAVNDEIPGEAEISDRTSTRKRASSIADCSVFKIKRSSSVVIDHKNEIKNEKTPETSERISRGVFRSSSSRRTTSVHDAIDCSSPLDESTPQVCQRYSRNMNKSSVHNHTEESDSGLPLEKTNPEMNISRASTMRRTVSSTSVDNLVVVLQEKLPETISTYSRSSLKGRKSSVILDEQNEMITWDVESSENNKSLVKSTVTSSTKRKTASLVSPTIEEEKIESDSCSVMMRVVSSTPAEILSFTGKTPEMISRSSVRGIKSLFVSDEEKRSDVSQILSRSMNESLTKASPRTSGRYSRKLNSFSVEARFPDSASPLKEKTLETISKSTGVRRIVSSTSLDNLVVVLQEKSPENNQRYSRNLESNSSLALEQEVAQTISKFSKWTMKGRKSSAICDKEIDIETPNLDKDTPETNQRNSRSAKRSSIHNQPEECNDLKSPFREKTPKSIGGSLVDDVGEENVKIRKSDTSKRILNNNLTPEISLNNKKLLLSRSRSMRESSLIELSDNSFDENDTKGSSLRLSSSSLTSEFDIQKDEQTTSQISFRRSSIRASLKKKISPSGHSEDIVGQSPSVRSPSKRNVPSEDNIGQSPAVNRKSSLSRHSLKMNSSATELSDDIENSFDQNRTKTSSNRRFSLAVRSKDDIQNEDQIKLRSSVRTHSRRNLSSEDNVIQSPLDVSRKSKLTRSSSKINSSLSDNDMEDSFGKEEKERSSNNRLTSSVRSQNDSHIERQATLRSSIRTASERNESSEDNVGSSLSAANRKSSLSRGFLKDNSSVELFDDDRDNSFDQDEIQNDLQNKDQIMLRRSAVRKYSKRDISSEDNVGQLPIDVNKNSSLRSSLIMKSPVIELSDNDMGDSSDQDKTESDVQNENQMILRRSWVRTYSRRNPSTEDNVGQSPLDVSRKSSLSRCSLKMNSTIEISDNDIESSFVQGETSKKHFLPSLRSENDLQIEDQTTVERSSLGKLSKINVPSSRHFEDIAGQSSLEAAANRKSSLGRRSLKLNSSAIEISDDDIENSFDQGETSNRRCSTSLRSENALQNEDQKTLKRSSAKTYSRRKTSSEEIVGQSPMNVSRKSSLSKSSSKMNSSATELSDNDMEEGFDQEETESDIQNEDQMILRRSSMKTYLRRNVSSEDKVRRSPLDVSRRSLKINSPAIDLSDMENSFDEGETSNRRSSSSFRSDNNLQNEGQTTFRHSEDSAGQSSLDTENRKSSLSRGSLKMNSSANELADDLKNSFDNEKTDRYSPRRSASFVKTESDLQSEDHILLRKSSVRLPARKNVSSKDNIDPEAANKESSPRRSAKINSSAIELINNDMENSSHQEVTEICSNRRSSNVRSQCDLLIEDPIMPRRSSVRTPSRRNVSSEDDIDPEATNEVFSPRSSAKINSPAIKLFDNEMENISDPEVTKISSNRLSLSRVNSQCEPQIEDQIMLRRFSVRTPLKRNVSTEGTIGQSSPEAANDKSPFSGRSANRSSSIVEPLVFESPAESFDSDSKQNRSKKVEVDLATPKLSAKKCRPDDTLYQPEIENVSPVTPENKIEGPVEGGFKTPLNTPRLFDEIRKTMLKSRTRHHKSTGNGAEELAGGERREEHGVKRQRVSLCSMRKSCKKMRLVINADDTFEESELLDSFHSDNIDDPAAVVNSICDSDENMVGVKKMFATPKVAKSPKNDLTDIPNLRKIMFPKSQNSPNNDLTDVVGGKRLMKTPKKQQQQCESIFLEGVAVLLATPTKEGEAESTGSDIENNEELFDRLFVRRRPRQYRGKTMSPKEREEDASGGGDRRKTAGDVPATPSPRVRHWVEEQRKRMKGMQVEASGDEESKVSRNDINLEPVGGMSPQEVVAEQTELTEISQDEAENAEMKSFDKRGRNVKTVNVKDKQKHVEGEKPDRTINRRGRNAKTIEVTDGTDGAEEEKPKPVTRGRNARTVETNVEEENPKTVNRRGRNVKNDTTVEEKPETENKRGRITKTMGENIDFEEGKKIKTSHRQGKNTKPGQAEEKNHVDDVEEAEEKGESKKPALRSGKNTKAVDSSDKKANESLDQEESVKPAKRRGRNLRLNVDEKIEKQDKERPVERTTKRKAKVIKNKDAKKNNGDSESVDGRGTLKDAEEAEEKGESKKPAPRRARNAKAVDPSDQKANESVDQEELVKTAKRRGRNLGLNVDDEIEKQDKEGPVNKTTKEEVKVTKNKDSEENDKDPGSVDGRGAVKDAEEAEEKGESKKPALRRGRNAKAVDPSHQKANESVDQEKSVKSVNRRGRNLRLNVDEEGSVDKTTKEKAKVTRNKYAKENDEDSESVDGRGAFKNAEEAEEKGESMKPALHRNRNAKALASNDQKANESLDKEESATPAIKNRRGKETSSNDAGENDEDSKSVDGRIAVKDAEKAEEIGESKKPVLRRGRNANAVAPNDQKANESIDKEEPVTPAIRNREGKVTRNNYAEENDEDSKSVDGRGAVKHAEEEIGESKKPVLRRGRNAKAVASIDQKANESIDKEESVTQVIRNGKGKVTRNKGSGENDEIESVDGRGPASASKRVLRGRRRASIDEEVVVPVIRGRKEKKEIMSAAQQVQTKAEQKLMNKVKSTMEEEASEKKRPRKNHRNEKKEEEEEVEAPVKKTRSRGNAAEKVTAQNVQDDSFTPRQTRAQRGNHKKSDYESGGSRRRNNRARF